MGDNIERSWQTGWLTVWLISMSTKSAPQRHDMIAPGLSRGQVSFPSSSTLCIKILNLGSVSLCEVEAGNGYHKQLDLSLLHSPDITLGSSVLVVAPCYYYYHQLLEGGGGAPTEPHPQST